MATRTINSETYPIWTASRVSAIQECLAISERASTRLEVFHQIRQLLEDSEKEQLVADTAKARGKN